MNLTDFILEISNRASDNESIYFNGGHNGPYNDSETPVRNKGHWLIIFSKCFELTGKQIYLDTVRKLAEYLVSKESRPYGYSFHHRLKEVKDKCNGLIGQAWTFAALAHASLVTENPKFAELAEEVFFQHRFNPECGLWNRMEIDGNIESIDSTFNHQLWFAACASILISSRRNEIYRRIISFLDALSENLTVLDNGLICHPIENQLRGNKFDLSQISNLKKLKNNVFQIMGIRNSKNYDQIKDKNDRMIYKSIGYHQFNIYAFAMLKETIPEHSFWQSPEFGRSVDYLLSDEFKNGISDNIYGFPYNPPGFEIPYSLSVLTDMSESELVEISSWWVNEQFKRCYNPKTRMMDRNTEDSLTHTARIYELANLSNSIMERIEVKI
jgi:hypothetical protein